MVSSDQSGPGFDDTLAHALDGQSAAFETLYNRYAGRIVAFGSARGTSDPEALANDVMLRVFQNLHGFEGDEAAFVRWLFTIARNRLIDLHRAEQRRPVIVDRDVPDRVLPSAEIAALEKLSLNEVVGLLGVLTVEQREVIALRLIDDLSLRDVAEIVGRPVTAVKALQSRGLRRLQKEILGEVMS